MLKKIFFFENQFCYETMWKSIAEQDKPQMTIRSMRIACWIHKTTNADSD